jgi:hypothetical protein
MKRMHAIVHTVSRAGRDREEGCAPFRGRERPAGKGGPEPVATSPTLCGSRSAMHAFILLHSGFKRLPGDRYFPGHVDIIKDEDTGEIRRLTIPWEDLPLLNEDGEWEGNSSS